MAPAESASNKKKFNTGLAEQNDILCNTTARGTAQNYTKPTEVVQEQTATLATCIADNTLKLNWIYELTIGAKHRILGGSQNPVVRKAAEGWQISGVSRLVSGVPSRLVSGRLTYNAIDGGVVLHNMTTAQLQGMVGIRKL